MIIAVGLWVSRGKKGVQKTTEDYFLASKSLPWWAIRASLIAANISAEQFIGMSGSGFAVGLAIASYEFMAALTLIIVGKFFFTYIYQTGALHDPRIRGKTFLDELEDYSCRFLDRLVYFREPDFRAFPRGKKPLIRLLVLGTGSYSFPLSSGWPLLLRRIPFTGTIGSGLDGCDSGGLVDHRGVITTLIALDNVLPGGGVVEGFKRVVDTAGDKFHMIISKDNPEFKNLPGIAVLIGGLWVANLYYWGFNQYIIQRTLAAKSLKEAQRGIAFAAFLKLIVPLIVVIPGIVAFVMYTESKDPSVTAMFEMTGGNDKSLSVADRDVCSHGFEGFGAGGIGCGYCFFTGLHAEFDFYHIHDGYL